MVLVRSRKMICRSHRNARERRSAPVTLSGELRPTIGLALCSSILLDHCRLLTKSQRRSTHREESLLPHRWSVRDCWLWSEYLCIASERDLFARFQLLSTESGKSVQPVCVTFVNSSRSLFRKVTRKNCSISARAFWLFSLFHSAFFSFWPIMSAMATWKMVSFLWPSPELFSFSYSSAESTRWRALSLWWFLKWSREILRRSEWFTSLSSLLSVKVSSSSGRWSLWICRCFSILSSIPRYNRRWQLWASFSQYAVKRYLCKW